MCPGYVTHFSDTLMVAGSLLAQKSFCEIPAFGAIEKVLTELMMCMVAHRCQSKNFEKLKIKNKIKKINKIKTKTKFIQKKNENDHGR